MPIVRAIIFVRFRKVSLRLQQLRLTLAWRILGPDGPILYIYIVKKPKELRCYIDMYLNIMKSLLENSRDVSNDSVTFIISHDTTFI